MSEGRTPTGERVTAEVGSARTASRPSSRGRIRLGRLRSPRLESLFVATFVLFGFRLGIRRIGDNSMLTHLRTGIDTVRGLGIPRVDPYSFTAPGHEWVVQSWLPEWTYGWAYRLGGFRLVVLEQALLLCLLVWLVVRLVRAGSPLRTAFGGLIVVGLGSPFWSPRPLLFGAICMALTISIVESRRSQWLLLPVVWVWVSSHGSFPLGLAWLGARAVGEAFDWRAWPRDAMRYVGGFAVGLVVAVVNPLGAKLLAFPFTLGNKRAAFEKIIEWRSPDFQHPPGRIALVFVVLALLLLVRARLSWRDVVPVVAFLAAGLLAVRNLPIAAVVLAPVLGRVLKRPDSLPALPPPPASRERVNRVFAVAIAAAFVVFGLSVKTTDPLDLSGYPVEATDFLEQSGLLAPPHRVAHLDFVGNYFELRFGRRVPVFIDDRYDMYPAEVSRDYRLLLSGYPQWDAILQARRIDVVVWDRELPLTSLLKASGQWLQIYGKGDWVVLRRL
ncbi:MAG: hypothetical protein QOI99_604 [Actinomycetota bacterium]|nr:hypothetical protein [Actinomycetota bacterium]